MESFREIGERVRNWGRWGADDEIGTVNFITPERLAAAAATVREGRLFSLMIPLDDTGPQIGPVRENPVHTMTLTGEGQEFPGGMHFSDDTLFMALQASTQWDSLAHIFYDDTLYNGQPASTITEAGATRNSIGVMARRGIVGRGVLLDIPRLKNVDHLQGGELISTADLDAACARQGVQVGSGDIVLVRTGWRAMFLATGDATAYMSSEPGLDLDCAEWLHRHEVAAVASDNWAVEAFPSASGDALPLHCILIRDMGMTIGEMFDLEELAEDCAADGRYDFFLAAAPLEVTGGVGSPLNPVAIK